MADAAGSVTARGLPAWSEDQLADLLGRCGPRSLILDLTRRGLQPFFGAAQICRQIGLAPDSLLEDLPPVLLPGAGEVDAGHIGSWIDFELFGDPARISADRVARAVARRGADHLVVLMPASLDEIPRADGLLLTGLAPVAGAVTLGFPGEAYALPDAWGLRCAATGTRAQSLPAPALPPGPLSAALRKKLALMGYALPRAVETADGWGHFAAAQRFSAPPAVPPMLAEYAAQWGWAGLPFILDTLGSRATAQLAWRAMAARDSELAILLARRALERPGDTGFARTTLATLYIIDQAYDRLSDIAADSQTDTLNRAWGDTLAGDAARATEAFDSADAAGGTALWLYRRNIAALAHFRTGDVATAWSHQHEIRDALDRMTPSSPHLRFINNLNMGRLARSQGDRPAARAYLESAFDARADRLSEHDLLYRETLRAGVAEDEDTVRRCWQEARALFGTQAHPGAIPKRAFRTIVGRLPEPFEQREIAVGASLRRRAALPELTS